MKIKSRFPFTLIISASLLLSLLMFQFTSSAQVQNWQPNTFYAVGAQVAFNGVQYSCIQAHTSLVGWEPPNVPALWQAGGINPTPTPTPTPNPTPTPTPDPGGGGCASAWIASTVYSASGTLVSRNGINYKNNWWTQGEDPATNNGPIGSGKPWTSVGVCSACTSIPSIPTGLSASGTTSNSTVLSWNPSQVASNCTITGYTVYRNGSAIGNASGTSMPVYGLTASTTYSFAVSASSSAGSSNLSAPIMVTTLSGGGGGGNPNFIFAAYKDVTINADWNTGLQRTNVTGSVQPVTSVMPISTLVWSFATNTCESESWAGISPAMEAINVQAFVNAGKKYILATGGAAGSFRCSSGAGLIGFINRYNSANLVGVDFDIESGQSQQSVDELIMATKAAQAQFPNLQFSFTIPTLGGSANPITGGGVGTMVVNEIKRLGLSGNYVINLMAMDYGSTNPSNCVVVNGRCDMGQSAVQAALALNQQSAIPLRNIGLTVMIGQNDTQDEVTSLANIATLSNFAKSNGLATVRFWAFDRDNPNGPSLPTNNGNGEPPLAYCYEFLKFFP